MKIYFAGLEVKIFGRPLKQKSLAEVKQVVETALKAAFGIEYEGDVEVEITESSARED